ncbi:MAG: gamma-glutamyltransferase [bacterium]|nr:gamma-glutamyltransferase [Gammaproteobacteria bacterium]
MQTRVNETWQVSKASISSTGGMVASQHHLASDVGAAILRQGGNAIDAAIATGLAIGTLEPWMSGIGGGGYTTIYLAKTNTIKVIEFGMRAPFNSVPGDYPLAQSGENSADAFNWPVVIDDVNIHGPLAVAVPGYIKGIALALESFGTLTWKEVIEPACQLAEWGLPIDWYNASKINLFARGLNKYPETRRVYLADGLPPVQTLDGSIDNLTLGRLASTYRRLQADGPEDYYCGALARDIASDLSMAGSRITEKDLSAYEATISEPLSTRYRNSWVHTAGPLTAGPSLIQALSLLQEKLGVLPSSANSRPDLITFEAYADSLLESYTYRLSHLGEGPDKAIPTNTTHICAADKHGNVVSHTQTIMSAFGSRIMLPETGILMNNGMMWFDPRPGGPNSVKGGRHPLCNMCPVIIQQDNGTVIAAGACGGRKIFPAIFQLISSILDFNMNINDAVHQPRIDVSGTDLVTLMDSLGKDIISGLENKYPQTNVRANGVSPNLFALPQIISRTKDGEMEGGCFIPSPHAKVSVV